MRTAAGTVTSILAALVLSSCIDSPATVPDPDLLESEMLLVWELFDERYVGFEHRSVDWGQAWNIYSTGLDTVTSREQMLALTAGMLGELQDVHVWLSDPSTGRIATYDPPVHDNFDMDVLMEYLQPWGFEWSEEDVWGCCLAGPDSIPYFVIASWEFDMNISLFDNTLERMLDAPGLVLDVRMAEGGSESPVSKVVRRFVDQQRVGHLLQYRQSTGNHDLTAPEEVILHPRLWHFGSEVLVLAGERSSGAAELFVCDLAELPHVTVVGDTTRGGADWPADSWPLTEGWCVTCPSRTVLRADTTVIEGAGIPPDIYVHADSSDFQSGIDPILEYALERLAG